MIHKSENLKTCLALAVALVLVPFLAAPALATDSGPVADVLLGINQVQWVPTQDFAGVTLAVSGPDGVVEQSFAPGEAVVFDLAALAGDADGLYTWQLTATPKLDAAAQAAIAASRAPGFEGGERVRPVSLPPRHELIQGGSFRVAGGAVVQPRAEVPRLLRVDSAGGGVESAAEGVQSVTAEQYISGDLTVHFSLCVGGDCATSESYGADTIRLKENNLRIHFDDTSSSASFPRNDWRLVANDSDNGGRNIFYLQDATAGREVFSVEAGAPAYSLYVDSSGRIGAGTDAPAVQFHVQDGNSPALRLHQDGSAGFTQQIWDVAGNEANFFVRDVTNGSKLSFRIKPGAPENSLFIAADGDVGMGTQSPGTFSNSSDNAAMHIRRTDASQGGLLIERATPSAASDVLLELRNNGTPRIDMIDTATNTEWRFEASGSGFNINDLADGGTAEFVIQTDGDVIIEGTLTTGGPTCDVGCDRVFDPDYPLESIEEHARQMWQRRHLPAIGPTVPGAPMNVSEKTGGILNELEKAHIYIEQLHNRLQEKQERLALMEQDNQSLEERIDQIESLLESLER